MFLPDQRLHQCIFHSLYHYSSKSIGIRNLKLNNFTGQIKVPVAYRVQIHLAQIDRCIDPNSSTAAFYIPQVDIDLLQKDQHSDIERYQHWVVRIDPNYDKGSAGKAFLLYKNHLSTIVHIRLDIRRYAEKSQ